MEPSYTGQTLCLSNPQHHLHGQSIRWEVLGKIKTPMPVLLLMKTPVLCLPGVLWEGWGGCSHLWSERGWLRTLNSGMLLGKTCVGWGSGNGFLPCHHRPPVFLAPSGSLEQNVTAQLLPALQTGVVSQTHIILGASRGKPISESAGWGEQDIEGFVLNWREHPLSISFRLKNFKALCWSN